MWASKEEAPSLRHLKKQSRVMQALQYRIWELGLWSHLGQSPELGTLLEHLVMNKILSNIDDVVSLNRIFILNTILLAICQIIDLH